MKNITFSFILLFFCLYSTAQIEVTVRIVNLKGQAMRNIEVSASNESSTALVKGTTDNTGRAKLMLEDVGVYVFSYLDQKIDRTYEVKAGLRGT